MGFFLFWWCLGFFCSVSIPSKKICANGCGFIEKCSVQLLIIMVSEHPEDYLNTLLKHKNTTSICKIRGYMLKDIC